MRFRKLRIAWSVVCGIACLVLIVLWVRSYSQLDDLSYRDWSITSFQGHLFINEEFWVDVLPANASATRYKHSYPLLLDSYNVQNVGDFDSGVAVPDWAVISPVFLVGVLPWIPWAKRFSLRTLLIATTLVAVVLGAIVWVAR